MCRKLIYISFVLLVSLVGISAAQNTDPTLVGWWKLDETSGATAADSSGMGYNGFAYGAPQWTTGRIDGALDLDGTDDYVDLPIGSLISSLTNSTFTVWVDWYGETAWQRIFDFGSSTDINMFLTPSIGGAGTMRFAITIGGGGAEDQTTAQTALPSGWHHVAVVIDADTNTHKLYLDGEVVAENTDITNVPSTLGQTTQNWLGRSQYAADAYFIGTLDDFRIYDRALTEEEIDMLVPRYNADRPQPANGGVITTTVVTLGWRIGQTADTHHVYVGESLEDVQNGIVDTDKGIVETNNYSLENLETGKTYYWRVDEIEADGVTVHTGAVWSFTVSGKIASRPVPASGTRLVDPNVSLTWTAGAGSIEHHIYLGDNSQDVQAGTADTDKGTIETAVFVPDTLEYEKTYYWRVDEFDGTTTYPGEVWSFRTLPDIQITNPNLVGWWKFDEDEGTVALDWSGNGNHGTLFGGIERIEGYDGGALNCDGVDDYVDLPIGTLISSLTSSTISIWTNFAGGNGSWQRVWDFGTGEQINMFLTPRIGTAGEMRFAITITSWNDEDQTTATATLPGGWHHVTVTIDPANTTHTLYLDGQVAATKTNARYTPSTLGVTTNNWLGRSNYGADAYYYGSLDDFRIYNYVQTQAEILEVMKGDPLPARNPKPANRVVTDVEKALPLSWTPGEMAAQHDVYLGTNVLAVEGANPSDATGIYRGRQDPNTYTPPEALTPGQTYYWRIDEVNTDGTISVGRIWNFTIADYLIVDDFEDYDDADNRIYDTWGDYFVNNTGMTVGYLPPIAPPYAEQEIVHGGAQAMYMSYDNDGMVNEGTNYEQSGTLFYSEAEREWVDPQDWTRKGVNSLSLWFRGLPGSLGSFTPGPPITMTAIGTDIGGTADQLHLAYKRLSGNGSITAKVLSISSSDSLDSLAKAGVMIRQTLEPGSVHAAIIATPASRAMFLRRINMDETTFTTQRIGAPIPRWVRLTRNGNTFTAQHSANGTSWTTVGSETITMLPDIYVGLCLTSRNANVACTAEFSDVDISPAGSVTGDWQSQDIGVEINAPEQLYVALQDSAGNSAVVNHPDSAATTIDAWTQWNITLTDFSGVNLGAITKMSIGVGNRANPQAGGAGDLYIDDIGLYLP